MATLAPLVLLVTTIGFILGNMAIERAVALIMISVCMYLGQAVAVLAGASKNMAHYMMWKMERR